MLENDELSAPLEVTLEVTSRCNLSCVYCYGCDGNTEPTIDEIKQIFDEVEDINVFQLCISGGEPFLRSDILRILEYANKKEIDVSIVTNGTLLDKKIVKTLDDLGLISSLQISIDSHLEHVHNSVRGKFQETITGLKNIQNYSSEVPDIGSVIHKQNTDTFLDTIDFFSPDFPNFHVMNIQATRNSLKHKNFLFVEPKKLALFWNKLNEKAKVSNLNIDVHENDLKELETARFTGCTAGKAKLVITPELNVIPCDIVREFKLGSLRTSTISKIWGSEENRYIKKLEFEPCYELNKIWFEGFV